MEVVFLTASVVHDLWGGEVVEWGVEHCSHEGARAGENACYEGVVVGEGGGLRGSAGDDVSFAAGGGYEGMFEVGGTGGDVN